jgi:hypothetical protein
MNLISYIYYWVLLMCQVDHFIFTVMVKYCLIRNFRGNIRMLFLKTNLEQKPM